MKTRPAASIPARIRSRTARRAARIAWVPMAWLLAGSGCLGFHVGPMSGEPAEGPYAQVGEVRVRYSDTGSGPAVVLLHGFASSLDTWAGLVPQLANDHRVIALDLKGFGWTDRPEGDYSPAAQAEVVLGLLDQLGVQRAALVAHSWGSSVALALALKAPERVERIALYDAYVYEDQVPMFFLWARVGGLGELLFALFYNERPDERMMLTFYDPSLVNERLAEEVERALARPGTRAAALAAARGQRYEELEQRYGSIERPVLLLWGREDQVTPLAFGERLAAELPDARLKVYPRCGHFPMIEAAAASGRDLAAFLSEGAP